MGNHLVLGFLSWIVVQLPSFVFLFILLQVEDEVVQILTDAEDNYNKTTGVTQTWDKLQREVNYPTFL